MATATGFRVHWGFRQKGARRNQWQNKRFGDCPNRTDYAPASDALGSPIPPDSDRASDDTLMRTQRLWRDAVAGCSIARLLLPEAVAYAGIANLPAQAGLAGLLVGLVTYGIVGTSRFAVVSATSSSAPVLAATTLSMSGANAALRLAFSAKLVTLSGVFLVLAGNDSAGCTSNVASLVVGEEGRVFCDADSRGHPAHLAAHGMAAAALAVHTASTAFSNACRSMPFVDI